MVDKLPPGALQPIATNWCHSVGELNKVDFEWTIHEYEFRGPGQRLQSAQFPIIEESKTFTFSQIYNLHDDDRLIWYLILEDEGISIYNCREYGPIDIRVKTSFVNSKREKIFSNEIIIHDKTCVKKSYLLNSKQREILLQKSNDLIVNGSLTIYCQVETYGKSKELSGKTPAHSEPVPWNGNAEMAKDFQELFENMKHSDVTINVTGQQFRAHKVILATRSPVFGAMFEHPSKENMIGIVDIVDIEPDVFKELLRFIYTGEVPSLRMDEVATGLLAAADKYLLVNLKKACGDHLIKQMSPEICVQLLLISEDDPAYYLRKNAVDYCRKFPAEVMATASWKREIMKIAPWMEDVIQLMFESLKVKSVKRISRISRK